MPSRNGSATPAATCSIEPPRSPTRWSPISGSTPLARRSPRSAACGAAARPAATSTSSRSAADRSLTDAFVAYPGRRTRARPRRDQGEHPVARRLPGRPALRQAPSSAARPCSTSPARRPTTSRCATGRSSAAGSSTSTACSTRRSSRSPARPRKASTRRSAWRGFRPSCARIAARSRPRPHGSLPALIEQRDLRGDLHMHTTESDGRESLETMVAGRARTRPRIHRDHRSLEVAGDGQRPG